MAPPKEWRPMDTHSSSFEPKGSKEFEVSEKVPVEGRSVVLLMNKNHKLT